MATFWILAAFMLAGALGVVTLRQPVHAALALVATLLILAVTFVTLEAHFLAAIQVIVYAGAIMVLFLFVIMLLNLGRSEARPAGAPRWLLPAALVTGLAAAAGLGAVVLGDARPLPDAETIEASLRGGDARALGEILFSEFVLAFQLVGLLLLTGIVGAVGLVQRSAIAPYATAVPPAAPPAELAGGSGKGR